MVLDSPVQITAASHLNDLGSCLGFVPNKKGTALITIHVIWYVLHRGISKMIYVFLSLGVYCIPLSDCLSTYLLSASPLKPFNGFQ